MLSESARRPSLRWHGSTPGPGGWRLATADPRIQFRWTTKHRCRSRPRGRVHGTSARGAEGARPPHTLSGWRNRRVRQLWKADARGVPPTVKAHAYWSAGRCNGSSSQAHVQRGRSAAAGAHAESPDLWSASTVHIPTSSAAGAMSSPGDAGGLGGTSRGNGSGGRPATTDRSLTVSSSQPRQARSRQTGPASARSRAGDAGSSPAGAAVRRTGPVAGETVIAETVTFVDRHVGPNAGERRKMLDGLGYTNLDALVAAAVPEVIRDDALDLPSAVSELEVLAELRRLGSRNRPVPSMIGLGYHPADARCDPAQRPGEPGLVHRIHPVPAGDLPGTSRGAAQLPDHDCGSDRSGDGRGFAAGRVDRRGRGHAACPPGRQEARDKVRRGRQDAAADDRGGPYPRRGTGGRRGGRGPVDRPSGASGRIGVRCPAGIPGRRRRAMGPAQRD